MNPQKSKNSTRRCEPLPEFLKVAQLSRLLNASANTVRTLIHTGELPAVTLNPHPKERVHYRVTRSCFLDFYEKRYGQPFPQEN